VIFISRYTLDTDEKVTSVKYYSIDDMLGYIGGLQSVFLMVMGFFLNKYSEISFFIKYSSALERIRF
jgi:hypothetical protein